MHVGGRGSDPDSRLSELYSHYGLDVNAILTTAEGMGGAPVRYSVFAEVSVAKKLCAGRGRGWEQGRPVRSAAP